MEPNKWKQKWKQLSNLRKWRIWRLKLIDARLYFVSIFVGLLTGLIAVPYHYLLVIRSIEDKELIVRSLGDKDKRQMYFTLSDKGKICLNQLKENEIEVPKMLKPLFK